jgi:hypothetical protein
MSTPLPQNRAPQKKKQEDFSQELKACTHTRSKLFKKHNHAISAHNCDWWEASLLSPQLLHSAPPPFLTLHILSAATVAWKP